MRPFHSRVTLVHPLVDGSHQTCRRRNSYLLARASCHFNSLSFVQSSPSLPLVTSTTVFVGSPMPSVSAPSSGSTTRTTGVQERATSPLPTWIPTTRSSLPALKTALLTPYASSLSCSLQSADALVQGGTIMLTHELNNFTMSEAMKFYSQLKSAFAYLVPMGVASNQSKPYVETGYSLPNFEQCP